MAFVCEEVEEIKDKLLLIGADDLGSVTMSALRLSHDEFGTTMKVGAICNIIAAKIDMQEIQNTNDLQMFFDTFSIEEVKLKFLDDFLLNRALRGTIVVDDTTFDVGSFFTSEEIDQLLIYEKWLLDKEFDELVKRGSKYLLQNLLNEDKIAICL